MSFLLALWTTFCCALLRILAGTMLPFLTPYNARESLCQANIYWVLLTWVLSVSYKLPVSLSILSPPSPAPEWSAVEGVKATGYKRYCYTDSSSMVIEKRVLIWQLKCWVLVLALADASYRSLRNFLIPGSFQDLVSSSIQWFAVQFIRVT